MVKVVIEDKKNNVIAKKECYDSLLRKNENYKLTTLIMKSLDEDATTALLALTARSVISPLIWKMEQNKWG